MEPQTVVTEVKKNPLFVVTPLSKYLAMIIFIAMPFVGAYIGYRLVPGKIIYIESDTSPTPAKEMDLGTTTGLCGKTFDVSGQVYIDGIEVTSRVAALITNEYQADQNSDKTVCHWILENTKNIQSLKLQVSRVNYDYSPLTSSSTFDAYLVTFGTLDNQKTVGEGNLIDGKTLEVFRVNEMDGSKGKLLGSLN